MIASLESEHGWQQTRGYDGIRVWLESEQHFPDFACDFLSPLLSPSCR